MRILEKDYVTIEYIEAIKTIALHWHENPTSDELKDALNVAKDHVDANGITNWIGNTAKMGAISEEDQEWINTTWFPTLIGAGIKKMAVVLAENIFGQMSIEEIMGVVDTSTGFESRYFDNVEKASEWIEEINSKADLAS